MFKLNNNQALDVVRAVGLNEDSAIYVGGFKRECDRGLWHIAVGDAQTDGGIRR